MCSPSKDCKKRKVGCHSNCQDYKIFNDERVNVRKENRLSSIIRSTSYGLREY